VLKAHLRISARPKSLVLQGWAGERILVDKTPSYVSSLDTLRRAEAIFEDARYIFLHRHPYADVASMAKLMDHGEWISGGLDGMMGTGPSALDSTAVDAAAATRSTILAAVEEAEAAAAAASGAGACAAPASPGSGGDSDAESEVGTSEYFPPCHRYTLLTLVA
jgi:hypothetical protein